MLNPIMSQHIYLRGAMDYRVGFLIQSLWVRLPPEGPYYYILGKVEF